MQPDNYLLGLGVAIDLVWNSFFVLGRAFEQQFLRLKNAVLAHLAGHDGLGFIAQQVRLYAFIDHLQPFGASDP